jgi:DNA adenine methylase
MFARSLYSHDGVSPSPKHVARPNPAKRRAKSDADSTLGRDSPLLSPLRYPGGKRRLVRYLDRLFQLNELRPEVFVEPFAGGASVSLYVLERELAERVILVDRDPLVSGFWKTVFDEAGSEWLIEQVRTIPVTLANWHRFRVRRLSNDRMRALACLFLNRTSFSGILHSGAGPIGGRKQQSNYLIGCRFPRETLIRRIRRLAAIRDRVTVWAESWKRSVARVAQMSAAGSIGSVCYYFDPPFFEKADRLYRFAFSERDHADLRDLVLTLDDSWILSYDVADELHRLWGCASSRRAHIELLYNMPQRVATEAILSNLDLPGLYDGAPPTRTEAVRVAKGKPAAPVIAWTPIRAAKT